MIHHLYFRNILALSYSSYVYYDEVSSQKEQKKRNKVQCIFMTIRMFPF